MELTDEELAVILSPTPFPNDSWPTEADVPLGAVVIEDGVVKQSRYVGNFDGSDRLTWDLMVGNDFELEICDFTPTDLSFNNWLFSQYIGGNVGRFRIELQARTNQITIQIGAPILLFNFYTFIENEYVKSIKFLKVGSDVTVTIGEDSQTKSGYGGVMQTELLEFGLNSNTTNPLSAEVGALKVNGEYYNLNRETGNTFTGSQGGIATLTDGIPEDFHKKTLVPI